MPCAAAHYEDHGPTSTRITRKLMRRVVRLKSRLDTQAHDAALPDHALPQHMR